MRRHEKQVTGKIALEQIVWKGQVCYLGINNLPLPYLVPMNYGYADDTLYFHSAGQGHKMELLRKEPRASFCIVVDPGIVAGERACNWGSRFLSVMGHGRVRFIHEEAEKKVALQRIMSQYSDDTFSFPAEQVAATTVFCLHIEGMTGKQSRI